MRLGPCPEISRPMLPKPRRLLLLAAMMMRTQLWRSRIQRTRSLPLHRVPRHSLPNPSEVKPQLRPDQRQKQRKTRGGCGRSRSIASDDLIIPVAGAVAAAVAAEPASPPPHAARLRIERRMPISGDPGRQVAAAAAVDAAQADVRRPKGHRHAAAAATVVANLRDAAAAPVSAAVTTHE